MTSGDFSDHNPKIGRDMVSNTLANPQHSVNTYRPSRFERMDALEYLKVDCGAALIPVADPANGLKLPADGFRQWPRWRSWQWEDLKGHAQRDGQFAIIPSSIGCAAADWDSPDEEALIAFSKDYSDALDLPTQRGYHFYFPNIDHFNPTKFTYHGVERGEAISRNSYAIMWSTAPQQLAAFVQNGYVRRRQPTLFPLDLLKSLERPASAPPPVVDTPLTPNGATLPPIDTWAGVEVGQRNITIFNELKFLAYASVKNFESWRAFDAALQTQAATWAQAIPDRSDFPDSEVRDTARSVSRKVWEWRDDLAIWLKRSDSATQSFRGRRSGERRRWTTRDRDTQIIRLDQTGTMKISEIAAQYGLTAQSVNRILKRERERERRKSADIEGPRPNLSLPRVGCPPDRFVSHLRLSDTSIGLEIRNTAIKLESLKLFLGCQAERREAVTASYAPEPCWEVFAVPEGLYRSAAAWSEERLSRDAVHLCQY